jgi:GTPase SAR1 family protein
MTTPISPTSHHSRRASTLQRVPFQIAVIGPSACGKSSILARGLFKPFSDEHEATIEENHSMLMTSDVSKVLSPTSIVDETTTDDLFELDIIDTGVDILSEDLLCNVDGVLIVYSADIPNSVAKATELYQQVKQWVPERTAFVLVQNKTDIDASDIPPPDASLPLVKCSAKTGDNVFTCFSTLVKEIVNSQFHANATTLEHASVARETRIRRESVSVEARLSQMHRKRDKVKFLLTEGIQMKPEYVVDEEKLKETGEIKVVKKKETLKDKLIFSKTSLDGPSFDEFDGFQ